MGEKSMESSIKNDWESVENVRKHWIRLGRDRS